MNIEQDYHDLLTYTRIGHLAKYVHMHRPYIYEDILKQKTYYPFHTEVELLRRHGKEITDNLQNISYAIEIGPGSYSSINFKSIPFLKSLKNTSPLKYYKALDLNLEYAQQACRLIEEKLHNICTEGVEVDFLSYESFVELRSSLGSINGKLLFGLGQPIFANNSDKDIDIFLKNLSSIMQNKDHLIFSVDVNMDEDILENAYNTILTHELLLNVMHFLKDKFALKNFNPDAFDLVYRWDSKNSTVHLSLKARLDQYICLNHKKFLIAKDNEYNIINSRKLEIEQVKCFLKKQNIEIKQIISSGNTKNNFFLISAQKLF